MTEKGTKLRVELEDLLTRNASTTAVTSGGDFAEIIQKRLFANLAPRRHRKPGGRPIHRCHRG